MYSFNTACVGSNNDLASNVSLKAIVRFYCIQQTALQFYLVDSKPEFYYEHVSPVSPKSVKQAASREVWHRTGICPKYHQRSGPQEKMLKTENNGEEAEPQ